MSLRRLWIFVSLLALSACASLGSYNPITPDECVARSDCFVVAFDNSDGKNAVEFRLNSRKYGEVPSYGRGLFAVLTSSLIHGNCAVVSAKIIDTRAMIISREECIYPGQYYRAALTNNQSYLWLVPFGERK